MHNPDDYRHLKKEAVSIIKKKGINTNSISEYSVLSMIPLVVIYTFIKEEIPEYEEFCNEQIERISKFYK